MLVSARSSTSVPHVLQFPVLSDFSATAGPHSTLRECFQDHVLPELDERAPATIKEYLSLLNRWEELTSNPPVETIGRQVMREFRKKLISTPYKRGKSSLKRKPPTVNKIMRTLGAMISPLWPADRHNPGGLGFLGFFKWPDPLEKQKSLPFVFSRKQLSALYLACSECRPKGGFRRTHMYNPRLWQAALVLALNVGARTWDLFQLKWEDIRWDDYKHGAVWFKAKKTRKPQRIPLNRAARQHLDYLRLLNLDPVLVFPGFRKGDCFYNAWDRICAKAGVSAPFETLRKTCSTFHNDVRPGVGAFITGHELKGVNATYYDNPTRRVIQAIYQLKLPAEFRRGAMLLRQSAT